MKTIKFLLSLIIFLYVFISASFATHEIEYLVQVNTKKWDWSIPIITEEQSERVMRYHGLQYQIFDMTWDRELNDFIFYRYGQRCRARAFELLQKWGMLHENQKFFLNKKFKK